MALSDRDIIITPNRGAATEPTILFRGADASTSASITLRVLNTGTVGTLSFEGTSGQLFSITDSGAGTIFSVNDISGLPSIEVLDTGEIKLAQYNGFISAGSASNYTNATSTTTGVLRVAGGAGIARDLYVGGTIYGNISGSVTNSTNVAVSDDPSNATTMYPTFVSGTSGNLAVRIDSTGLVWIPSSNRLGIGTNAPGANLDVQPADGGDSRGLQTFFNSSATYNPAGENTASRVVSGLKFNWYSENYTIGATRGGGTDIQGFVIAKNGAVRLSITSGGNIGVGYETPPSKFWVQGNYSVMTSNAASSSYPDRSVTALMIGPPSTRPGTANVYSAGIGFDHLLNYSSTGNVTYGNDPHVWIGMKQNDFPGYERSSFVIATREDTSGTGKTIERVIVNPFGIVGIGTSDFSYTASDNSPVVGSFTNNKLFVNGSIQLLGNNDAIVFGRGTSSFFKDEEVGFGWGGGWYMVDGTYLRSRNNKHIYNENIITGTQFQHPTTSYNKESFIVPRWNDNAWAFGMASNDSSTFWLQAKYYGDGSNNRGFRVKNDNGGGIVFAVNEKIIATQNTVYGTWQSYSGSDNGPMKTWDGVLVAGSDSSSANAYTVIESNVPQDSYMMGGFTINWFENYYSTNAKTDITLGGYWNPESNGGFLGFEYTSSNPSIVPTIQVGRNISNGKTVFILSHFNSSYAIIVARDLWLGYSGGSYDYGSGWTISQQSSLAAYTNLDTVVARTALVGSSGPGSSLNADLLDGVDSTQFVRTNSASVSGAGITTENLLVHLDWSNKTCVNYLKNLTGTDYSITNSGISFSNKDGIGTAYSNNTGNRIIVNGITLGTSMTYEAWVNSDGFSGYDTVFDNGGERPLLGALNSVMLSYPDQPSLGPTLTAGRWYHLVWVMTGGTTSHYVNGLLKASGSFNSGNLINSGVLWIGGDGGGESWYGHIAVARVYNKALSETEIARNFEAEQTRFFRPFLAISNPGADYNTQVGFNLSSGSTEWSNAGYHIGGVGFAYSNSSGPTASSGGGEYIEYPIPHGARTCYINYLAWSDGGYYDVFGLRSGVHKFLGRFGNYQGVRHSSDTNTHDGVRIDKVGSLDLYTNLRFVQRKGRLHLMGLGWTAERFTDVTPSAYAHYDNIFGAPGTIWNSSNDGSGSGLDADLLDGVNSGQFMRRDYADQWDQGVSSGSIHGGSFIQKIAQPDSHADLLQFRPPTSVEYFNGSTWVAQTVSNYNNSFNAHAFMTYGAWSIPNGQSAVRMTWQSFGYHFWEYLTINHSTNGNSFRLRFQKSDLSGVFGGDALTLNGISSWPGYTSARYQDVSGWWDTRDVRLVFDNFGWNNGNAISIGHIGLHGSYSGYARTFDWDFGRNMFFYGEVTAYYSDRRLKENINKLEGALAKVRKLNGVSYNPNKLAGEFGYENRKEIGLLADEVEAVLPEIVRLAPFDRDSDGNSKSGQNYKTVQYDRVVPLLVEAIKEQQVTIDSILAEIRKLANK
jgi:hypothetical protein